MKDQRSCTDHRKETQKQADGMRKASSKDIIQSYRGQTAYIWRLTLPTWMCSKALEFAGMRVPAGWNWFFRVYNLIPSNSKVVDLVSHGDIEGLRECFASKEASPFDRISPSDFFGNPDLGQIMHGDMTLLHVGFLDIFALSSQADVTQNPLSACLPCAR